MNNQNNMLIMEKNKSVKERKKTLIFPEFFKDPPSLFRPVVFWSWNEKMSADEISRQIDLLKKAGGGGGFIHSRIGLLTEYLSKDWFKAVEAAIESSKKAEFKVFLYDEDKWPSGFAGGKVPLSNISFRLKALVARKNGQEFPDNCEKLPSGWQDLVVYKWTAPLGHDWFNGTCYADLMDKEAMACFIQESYQSYYDKYSKDYGNTIVCQFTDEPCTIFRGRLPEGSVPYTDSLPKIFKKLYGYDPVEHYYKLFTDSDDAQSFRIHYFRTINYLFENNFSKQIAQWCAEHNIALTGHYMMETSMYGQQTWGTKVMANYRHQQWPGIDHLGRRIDEVITGKQCQSVVNQFGKERMLSEMYGCSGQDMSFEDRLWIASQQLQLGVNLINPHLSLYTMAGCRKRDFPPNLFYQQPWWPVNEYLDIPLARLCYALSKGKYKADILMIHPQESAFALWQTRYEDCSNTLRGDIDNWDFNSTTALAKEQINRLDKSVKSFISGLLDRQCHFDFGDETIIAEDAEIVTEHGKVLVKIGQMVYSQIILPDMFTIAESTLGILEKFVSLGGKVYATNSPPKFLDGRKSKKLEKFLESIDVMDKSHILKTLSEKQQLRLSNKADRLGHIWTHIRDLPDGSKTVLVSNLNRSKTYRGDIVLEGYYDKVQLFDHWNGEVKNIEYVCKEDSIGIPITLEPVQSRLIILNSGVETFENVSLKEAEYSKKFTFSPEDFDVQRLDANSLILDCAYWKEGSGKFSNSSLPVIAIQERLNSFNYIGKLELQYKFNVNDIPSGKVYLVIEHPEYYKIFINGEEKDNKSEHNWLDIRFSKINITEMIKEGENSVHLVCDYFHYGDQTNYENIFARYGTEIEAVYIVGDFDVNVKSIESEFDSSCWEKIGVEPDLKFIDSESISIGRSSSLKTNHITDCGLAFYAGRIQYTAVLPEIDAGSKKILSFEKLNASCAEIFIDNTNIGAILTSADKLDLSKYYKSGKVLKILLYSSLRNILGPHHHIDGEILNVSPLSFMPMFEDNSNYALNVKKWDDGELKPKNWKSRYCLCNFGNLGKVVITSNLI